MAIEVTPVAEAQYLEMLLTAGRGEGKASAGKAAQQMWMDEAAAVPQDILERATELRRAQGRPYGARLLLVSLPDCPTAGP